MVFIIVFIFSVWQARRPFSHASNRFSIGTRVQIAYKVSKKKGKNITLSAKISMKKTIFSFIWDKTRFSTIWQWPKKPENKDEKSIFAQMSIQKSESVIYHPAVIWSFGHLVKMISELSKSSTIYKYLIFIYSEQMTHSENGNDHFDLDHFDHNLPHPSSSHIALMLLLCYSYLKWELYGICIGVVYALIQRHFLWFISPSL